jgi:DNA polymerase IV
MKKELDILLCDLDAFYASVEQLDHPELKGKPVIVGGDPAGRGVASTCSYEARKFGVRSAMPMKKALELCPQAIVVRGNMARYGEVAGQVREIFGRYTPDLEIVSIDEAYLAVKQGLGLTVAENIHRKVREELGLPISVGVSSNKLLAKVACELAKPDAVKALWMKDVPELFWPLPVRAIPGIGPKAAEKLKSLGLKTVKDLAHCPPATLRRIFGNNSANIHRFACGLDDRELEPVHDLKSISEETTFPEDIHDRQDYLPAVIRELAAGVGYRLRSSGLKARTITLKLRYSDFKTITRSKTLPDLFNSDKVIYELALDLFNKNSGRAPWRLVGVKASGFEEEEQLSLLIATDEERKEKQLLVVKDSLQQKYGSAVVVSGKQLKDFNKQK